jgi:hypothetical protein
MCIEINTKIGKCDVKNNKEYEGSVVCIFKEFDKGKVEKYLKDFGEFEKIFGNILLGGRYFLEHIGLNNFKELPRQVYDDIGDINFKRTKNGVEVYIFPKNDAKVNGNKLKLNPTEISDMILNIEKIKPTTEFINLIKRR